MTQLVASEWREPEVVRPEREATEQPMAETFAHEIRNALAASKLVLIKSLGGDGNDDSQVSMTMEAANDLGELYESLSQSLGDEDLRKVHKILNALEFLDDSLRLVLKSVNRALRLTTTVMSNSRLERAGASTALVPLSTVIGDVLSELKQELGGRDISVFVDIDEAIHLRGGEMQCHSIIQNLVNNARDALVDRTAADPAGLIEIRARAGDGRCVLEVRDNGIGIRQGDAERIFQPFYSTKSTGSGLGLAITKKMIEIMGGDICVQSEWGKGSQFTVTIPLPL